jgi:hypothetical protein
MSFLYKVGDKVLYTTWNNGEVERVVTNRQYDKDWSMNSYELNNKEGYWVAETLLRRVVTEAKPDPTFTDMWDKISGST